MEGKMKIMQIRILQITSRNRLSPRYINIATTPIQQFESKGILGQQQNMPKKKEMTTKAK
jgi:hypothetical protein